MTTGEVGDGGDGGECVFWGGGGVTEGGVLRWSDVTARRAADGEENQGSAAETQPKR